MSQKLLHQLIKAKKIKIEEEDSRCNFVLDFLYRQNQYPLELFSSQSTQEDRMIHLFDHMKDLKYLSLRNCITVSDQILSHIPSNCRYIDLSIRCLGNQDQITDKGILSLFSYCNLLESLDLYGRRHLSDKGFSNVNPALLSITLPGLYCSQITFKTIERIEQECPYLKSLDLSGSIFPVKTFKDFKHLQYLDLSFCANVRNVKFEYLNRLKVLNLKGVESLSDFVLIHLSENCLNLEKLYLSYCSSITDQAICLMLKNIKHLQLLDLSRCTRLTSQIIPYLIEYTKSLKKVNLIGCFFKGKDLLALQKAHPSCVILS